MKLSQFFKLVVAVTFLSLIYIHMQMKIFDLAYQAKKREQLVRKLNEVHGNLTYNILKLKSAHNLGYKLLAENSNMQFLDNSQIVKIETPRLVKTESVALSAAKRKANPILSFLSLRSQAEAKPQE